MSLERRFTRHAEAAIMGALPNRFLRGIMLLALLSLPHPGWGQEPEHVDLTRMKESAKRGAIDVGWYPCDARVYLDSWEKTACISITTRHGLEMFGQQVRSRQDGDRRVLLELITRLESRIAALEEKIATADMQRSP